MQRLFYYIILELQPLPKILNFSSLPFVLFSPYCLRTTSIVPKQSVVSRVRQDLPTMFSIIPNFCLNKSVVIMNFTWRKINLFLLLHSCLFYVLMAQRKVRIFEIYNTSIWLLFTIFIFQKHNQFI